MMSIGVGYGKMGMVFHKFSIQLRCQIWGCRCKFLLIVVPLTDNGFIEGDKSIQFIISKDFWSPVIVPSGGIILNGTVASRVVPMPIVVPMPMVVPMPIVVPMPMVVPMPIMAKKKKEKKRHPKK